MLIFAFFFFLSFEDSCHDGALEHILLIMKQMALVQLYKMLPCLGDAISAMLYSIRREVNANVAYCCCSTLIMRCMSKIGSFDLGLNILKLKLSENF